VVAVALTVAGPVGVDVEAVAAVSAQPVERVALSDRERRAIHRLPPDARPEALAEAWVRKEAALKALGTGLRVDPRAIRLSGRLRGAARMSGGGASLTTAMLALGPGVAGAVALARAGRHRPSLQVELHDGDALLARLT
ncbi:MAG TPA: 4'-phosphopantetheinyl transferase superfamily protein, partial [Actinotalea sp.]